MLADIWADDGLPAGKEVAFGQPGIPFAIFYKLFQNVGNQGGISWTLATLWSRPGFFDEASLVTAEQVEGKVAFSHLPPPLIPDSNLPDRGSHRTLLTIALVAGHFQQQL